MKIDIIIDSYKIQGLSSSVETLSDVGAAAEEEKSDPNISPSIAESEEDFPFYKPNMDTPPRFKSSDNEFEATESSITLDNEPANLNESSTDDGRLSNIPYIFSHIKYIFRKWSLDDCIQKRAQRALS